MKIAETRNFEKSATLSEGGRSNIRALALGAVRRWFRLGERQVHQIHLFHPLQCIKPLRSRQTATIIESRKKGFKHATGESPGE
jgi:hypothetical protein